MSQKHYIKKWDVAQTELARIVRIERPLKPPQPHSSRDSAFDMVVLRYLKFVIIYHRLIKCYDYMVHPQKRILIGRCLDGVTGRILELREEMIRLQLCEYSFLLDVLKDLKLTPSIMELPMSKFIGLQRVAIIRKRTNMLDYILASLTTDSEEQQPEIVYTTKEAVLLIQKNERAFQARRRTKAVKRRKRGGLGINRPLVDLSKVFVNERGIILFQAIWRGHKSRKNMGSIKRENAYSLDMAEKEGPNISVTENKVLSTKFKEANENQEKFMTDTILITENMLDTKGPSMAEDMKRELIQWILECRNITGQFPTLPEEEKGGSGFLFVEKSIRDLEDDMDELQEELDKGKKKKKEKKKKEKKKKDKKKGKASGEYVMKPSKFVDEMLVPECQEYGLLWRGKEESYNRKQRFDMNLLLEDVTKNVETVVRQQVDELIREELENMKVGIDHQKRPKAKKDKKKKDKKKKKGKKGKKGKKMKDLTPGVAIEDLYKDMVLDGIIKKVPSTPLESFLGEYNFLSNDDYPTTPMKHDLGDVRKMIIDFGILPMSSETVHKSAPFYKSLILVGPHGSGKKMLVNAIAYELGASLFDLSAENLEDKYEGKQGQQMLIHLVMKVGKAMEPSVIFIGECDQMFTKKLAPEIAQLKPGRLKKDLMKALKFITAEDRILLIGTSKFPFKAAVGPMMKMYQRLIMIYPPSHASRYTLWKKQIKENKGVLNDDFDLTALSHVTRGYTAGDITNAVREVLTEKRVQKQIKYPIRTEEFVLRISTFDPVFIPEMEEFDKWVGKTPLKKKHNKIRAMEDDGIDIMGKL